MWVKYEDKIGKQALWCEPLTDKQRHNRNCKYLKTIENYDIYVLGEKYYCCPEND